MRHFGGLQIDPTRTVEKTHYLVLWSRLGAYDRAALDRVTYQERRLVEHDAFYVPIERLPELRFERGPIFDSWPSIGEFLTTNRRFRDSILGQLRDRGPLPSRDIDDSTLIAGWQSSGWTHEKNTTRMLEIMAKALDVVVVGRQGRERVWDLPERGLPPDAPTGTLDLAAYAEARLDAAMRRFGVADLASIKAACYWVTRTDRAILPRLLARRVEEGRLVPISLPTNPKKRPAWATPEALEVADSTLTSRTTLVSPFDRLIYDRERTESLFGFSYKLEMYVPREERQFGHFVLPVLHDSRLIGRLDSERDRKTSELVVRRLHWEDGRPDAVTARAVDQAVASLAHFVRTG